MATSLGWGTESSRSATFSNRRRRWRGSPFFPYFVGLWRLLLDLGWGLALRLRPCVLPEFAGLGNSNVNSKVRPIARVCGGTSVMLPCDLLQPGLSPRVRGHACNRWYRLVKSQYQFRCAGAFGVHG